MTPRPHDPRAAADLARRISRARLAAALARLSAMPTMQDWDRLSRADRLAILREIRATRAALDSIDGEPTAGADS